MRTPLFVLVLAHCLVVPAQRVIDLSAAEPDLRGIRIAVDTVVLGFGADAPLGTLHASISGNDKRLSSKEPIDEALSTLLRRSLASDSAAWHVALKVNVLQLEDNMIGKQEIAFCSLHIEFFERSGSSWVRCYDHGTSLSSDRAGVDRWHHTTLLARCIEEVFHGAWTAHRNGLLNRTPAPLNNARTPAVALDLPIARAQALRPGIYTTFQDFRSDKIDTLASMSGFDITTVDGAPIKGSFGKSADLHQREAWGCSDGERLYMNLGPFYVPLKWDGQDFTARVPLGDVATGISPAMGMFGLVGASAVLLSRTTVVTETTVRVDLLSGRIEPLLDRTINGAPSRARCYFIHSKHSASDTTACLFIFGGRETCLRPGQHYEYEPLRRADALPVEVRCGTSAPRTVYLDTKVLHDQVILIKSKRDGSLIVDELSTVMAEGLIGELEPGNAVGPTP
ncbi:MAG: hypothetical protein IPJ76_12695 [Flavobacteriales bacterium]|nr:MAG: hypothetical protein IPJ76_12695 [Flavobacteriales bacterium]